MTLKSFPRGGKKPDTKHNTESLHSKKRKSDKSSEEFNNQHVSSHESLISSTVQTLNYSLLHEGMILFGRIHNVTEYDAIIALPGHLSGILQATDISESYTKLLKAVADTETETPPEFKNLSELYSPGDYIICYVKSINVKQKWKISLSLEPQYLNQNLDPSTLMKTSKVAFVINSIEDHGYVLETGLKNCRAFLRTKDVEENKTYFPGTQVMCAIKEVNNTENVSTLKVSTKAKHLNKATESFRSLDTLIPRTRVKLVVQKVLSNGLQITFNGENIGYINQVYLEKPISAYTKGMEVIGTLLYVLPTIKFAYFSLLPNETETNLLKVGDVIDKVTVISRDPKGIIIKLSKGIRGFIPLPRTGIPFEKIPTVFSTGSIHKCRIIAYDWIERLHICTAEKSLLEEQHFSMSTLQLGDTLEMVVKSIHDSGFVNISAGRILGTVQPEQISDIGTSSELKIGQKVNAKVLQIDKERHRTLFTLKKSLLNSKLPILSDISQAKVGSTHHCTVLKITKTGVLVRFFGSLKGWVPFRFLNRQTAATNWNLSVGKVVIAKIRNVDPSENKLTVSIESEKQITVNFSIGETVTGIVVDSSAKGVQLQLEKDDIKNVATAFLPAGHMAPCIEVGKLLAMKMVSGDVVSAIVFATTPTLILTKTLAPSKDYSNLEKLKTGDLIMCSVKQITRDHVKVILPIDKFSKFGRISINNTENLEAMYVNQILFAKVLSINKKKQEISLSTLLHDVWLEGPNKNIDMMTSVDALSLYLHKINELSKTVYFTSRPISSINLGQRIEGVVEKVTDHGLILKLNKNLKGVVRKEHYSKNLQIGDKVNGTVLWVNFVNEYLDITLNNCNINIINVEQNELINTEDGSQYRGEIVLVTKWFILAVLKGQGKGTLVALPAKRHINDIEPDLKPYLIGNKIRCYIVLNKDEADLFVPICMLKAAFERHDPDLRTTKSHEKKKKRKLENTDDACKLKRIKADNDAEKKSIKKEKEMNIEEDNMSIQEFTEIETDTNGVIMSSCDEDSDVESVKEQHDTDTLPMGEFFFDNKHTEDLQNIESSSSSDEEEDDRPKQKKKKLSAAERREEERQKEREIRLREEVLASSDTPTSVDQFERLVMTTPNNSHVWIQFMAYHLQSAEIEKVRGVAQRATKAINFREETERLNVWQAWLSFESRYGSSESLEAVFQEAVRTNDAEKIYSHMLIIHSEAGRQAALEKIITSMLGKFKQNPETWEKCGTAYLKLNLKDKSRHIMQRALQSLPKNKHVNLIIRFALLENKYGDKERSQTLFDEVLSTYPKRTDVWSTYVDCLVKAGDINNARKVLDRAVALTLPAKEMKTLFKKYIQLEEVHGTAQDVSRIQELAVQYVDKQFGKDA